MAFLPALPYPPPILFLTKPLELQRSVNQTYQVTVQTETLRGNPQDTPKKLDSDLQSL